VTFIRRLSIIRKLSVGEVPRQLSVGEVPRELSVGEVPRELRVEELPREGFLNETIKRGCYRVSGNVALGFSYILSKRVKIVNNHFILL